MRETALDRLGSLSGDNIELIAARLDDPDPVIRGSAATNLGGVRRAEAWPLLMRAARRESSDEVRRHIVAALGRYHDPEILDLLLVLLAQRDRDYRIRLEVVVQLWKYDPIIAAPALVEVALGDDHELVRLHGVDSLELLDERCPREPSRYRAWLRLAEDENPAIAELATRALHRHSAEPIADAVTLVARRLRHADADERSIALDRLSMLAPASSPSLARPLLNDEQPKVRVACCACLGAIRDDTAIPLLLSALREDPASTVKTAALLGLENYHTVEIGSILLERLETEAHAGDALSILCRQLWKYPSARTVEFLRRTLEAPTKLPHRAIVEDALAFVERLLSDQAEVVETDQANT